MPLLGWDSIDCNTLFGGHELGVRTIRSVSQNFDDRLLFQSFVSRRQRIV
jgi:hypothetical protein